MTTPPAVFSDAMTIGALLRWSRGLLDEAGVENAAQESVWLSAHALRLQSHQLATESESSMTAEQWRLAESLIRRRAGREPLQYLLGTQEFCGLDFDVTPAALIPRPETELLVQEAVRHAGSPGATVVDVGTGSGCIAVALALVLSDATIIATDRSSAALTLAQHNAAKHGVTQRIEWLEGDCLEPLKAGTAAHSVDLIAANPPYIPERDWASLQPEVRLFEPRMALVGGEDGMELHGRLLRDAPEFLRDNGLLIMEIGEGQGPALRRLAEQVGAYAPLRVLPDAAGIERVVIAQRVG